MYSLTGRGMELLGLLEASHPALERPGQEEGRPGASRRNIQDEGLGPQLESPTEEPHLGGARRILEIMLGFGDAKEPFHLRRGYGLRTFWTRKAERRPEMTAWLNACSTP